MRVYVPAPRGMRRTYTRAEPSAAKGGMPGSMPPSCCSVSRCRGLNPLLSRERGDLERLRLTRVDLHTVEVEVIEADFGRRRADVVAAWRDLPGRLLAAAQDAR